MTANVTLRERQHLPIKQLLDVVTARRKGLEIAQELGFPLPEATKVAVVISELARNILLYAQQGSITLTIHTNDKTGIEILAEDQGQGIPDIDKVMAGGYTTSKGMGLGLSGSKKLMDEFHISSVVSKGTTIKAAKWLR